MDSLALCSDFDEETYKANHDGYVQPSPRFADTHLWAEHGIELAKVLSENMLVKEITTRSARQDDKTVKLVSVHLCYNWKSKTEFVLVKITLAETFSYYTPQYGRDDNYSSHTRCDYQFLAYSVEAFKQEQPDLARCLEEL